MAKKATPHTPTREEFFAGLSDADIDRAFTLHYSGEVVLDKDDMRDYAKERQRRITAGTWTGLPIGGEKGTNETGGEKPAGTEGETGGEKPDEQKPDETAAAAEAEKQRTEDEIRAANAAAIKAALAKGAGTAPAPAVEHVDPVAAPVVKKEAAPSSFIAEGRKLNFGPG